MPTQMNTLSTNFSQTRTFDKIAWLPREGFAFSKVGVVPFGDVLDKESGQTSDAAKKNISDHLPLWCEFKVNKLIQELDQIINPGPA